MALSPTSVPDLTTAVPPVPATLAPPPAEASPPAPPAESPPPPPTESPPPPAESPPPPTESPPPPDVNAPPPSPPVETAAPPPENPPPPPAESPPPPAEEVSPPPPPPDAPSPSSPVVVTVSPPANSPPSPDISPPPPSSPSTSAPPPSQLTPSTAVPPPPPPSSSTSAPPPSASKASTPPSPSSATNSSSSVSTAKSTTTTTTDGTLSSSSSSSSSGGDGVKYGAAIAIVSVVVVIGFIMGIMYVRRQKKKNRYNPYIIPTTFNTSPASGSYLMQPYTTGSTDPGEEYKYSSPEPGMTNSQAWFSYEELSTATNGFASHNILGAGGFGTVYKGYLQDGREVAVKRLKAGGGQGDREFKAEVEIISRVHHRHLVTLVGYCINEYQKLLVYEFVPNDTLYHHLHATGKQAMEWSLRVKAAAGSARGIAYLHEDCHPRIIHRDIKTANILLENNFEAKVADFGLAKLAEELDLNTHISTRVMGTFGYMAPEYASSGKLTEKSDVFSFGVVLLEMITGRKPVDQSQPLGDESLVEWARPLMTRALDDEDFDELADPRLEGTYDRREMFRMIEAAAACVRHSASKRPKMSQVVRALDTLTEASTDLSNGMRPGQSEIYDSREQSAQIRMFQRMAFGSQDMGSEYNMSQASLRSGPAAGH